MASTVMGRPLRPRKRRGQQPFGRRRTIVDFPESLGFGANGEAGVRITETICCLGSLGCWLRIRRSTWSIPVASASSQLKRENKSGQGKKTEEGTERDQTSTSPRNQKCAADCRVKKWCLDQTSPKKKRTQPGDELNQRAHFGTLFGRGGRRKAMRGGRTIKKKSDRRP